ncbi:Bug family tripartite tricarboxylate transporter substrate binding protein [Pollutimonas harenae]|uniref:Tripartite tricarboxylate transporter substrate binding protein n=1 Tax=Pollutimonas harenae TaxID=657015 RepID=A0A853GMC0_9BURK|nr:tripartite tricarboxylate transporter substrate binding protein [Pollutimonas harenae]NYT84138.1 tripartite tricarboxylate transporter substrate binding protein [Pollutimonas harenae]TEA73445.1 tripartite tricarboxylate transporter substrate binding protein [Pollutimonas harenae]
MFGDGKFAMHVGKTVAVAALLVASTAWAQDKYPAKMVEVVVPWTAGQATDIAARTFAEELTAKLDETFFISNKAGAGGAVGSAYVARAKTDGYTLLAASTGSVIVSPLLNITSYAASDFVPAAMIAKSPSILITASDFPAKNINELIKLLKDNPGKYTFASSGNGSATHLMAEAFNMGYGIEATHVPYKGSSAALTDVLAGRVTYMFDTVASVSGQLKAGKVTAYAISSKDRSASVPDIPAIAEVTELKDFDIASWIGLMAPKGTSPESLSVIEEVASAYLKTPEAKAKYQGMGLGINPMSNQEFQKVVDREVELYSGLLEKLGLKQ